MTTNEPTITLMSVDGKEQNKANLINRFINRLSDFLDWLDSEDGYISERQRKFGDLSAAITFCAARLKKDYPDCKFEITYNGFIPVLGATIFVRQKSGNPVDKDRIVSILKQSIYAATNWDDAEYGFVDIITSRIRGRFILSKSYDDH